MKKQTPNVKSANPLTLLILHVQGADKGLNPVCVVRTGHIRSLRGARIRGEGRRMKQMCRLHVMHARRDNDLSRDHPTGYIEFPISCLSISSGRN